jgi:exopolyphosphatase/guanosine-5'-triphosphate,3'-diphosphate pyrophosphatase
MKVAAIDLGSNSIHMVIVEISASGGFQVVDREKQMVRLGAGTLARGRLSAAAIKRGLAALVEYKRLADSHGVDKIIAVATSAIREASNGEDFLEQVGRTIGVWPRAISGEEEAGLIYLAALHSIHLEGKRALVLDIGGGSVELVLGAGEALERAVSEKLGVLRLSETFVKSDPLSAKDESRLVSHVETSLAPATAALHEAGFDCVVGTSGTILALGAMAHAMEAGIPSEALHHVTVRAETLHALRKRLVASTLRERLRMPGMDERRADILAVGAVVLDTILKALDIRELTLCEWALREGILIDYIQGHARSLARAEAYPDVRRRSVVALAERCLYDEPHVRQVARLALVLFDATSRRHGYGAEQRALLEHTAWLHDVGHHISYPGHHKHSYYLIKNGGLRGFSPEEIEVIANVARYHRRGLPRKRHASFGALPGEGRRLVRVLAGLLRIADALDRSHRQVVRAATAVERAGVLRVTLEAEGDCELELWGVGRRAAQRAQSHGLRLRVEAMPVAAAAPVRLRSRRG